ncbi:PASTA domain-containing protein, partial [Agrococcus sp. HG114]|uniref:PASTA domain-containing protein n=1 Tax=Agrococcus sp. HG114 TaxID=2969757 RepID=UPI00215A7439
VVLGALVAAGVGWWFNLGPGGTSTVPDVSGEAQDAAIALLAEHGIEVAGVTGEPDYDTPAGLALRTEPGAGTVLGNGEAVQLVVSQGRRSLPVPALAGLPLEQARAEIEAAGFTVAEGEPDRIFDGAAAGTVLAALAPDGTDLAQLTALEERSPIALRVSLGPIPAQAGQPAAEARAALEQAGLLVDFSREEHSLEVPAGALISLAVPEAPVRQGATIGGVVSLGPRMLEVPDVVGMPIPEAVQAVRDAGLVPELRTNVPEALRALAAVLSQDPGSPGPVVEGSTVVLDATY